MPHVGSRAHEDPLFFTLLCSGLVCSVDVDVLLHHPKSLHNHSSSSILLLHLHIHYMYSSQITPPPEHLNPTHEHEISSTLPCPLPQPVHLTSHIPHPIKLIKLIPLVLIDELEYKTDINFVSASDSVGHGWMDGWMDETSCQAWAWAWVSIAILH